MHPSVIQIRKAIQNFKTNHWNENDFLSTIESISGTITENEMYELRMFLNNIEYELENINYMIDKELRREKYLLQIINLENYLILIK